MAISITTNLDDAEEAELNLITSEVNATESQPGVPSTLTPSQVFRRHARNWIRNSATAREEATKIRRSAVYKTMSPEDRQAVDLIFNKYI